MNKLFLLIVALCAFNIAVFASKSSDSEINRVIPLCIEGGPGSTTCSIDGSVHGTGASCSVECRPGYYACCGLHCTCMRNISVFEPSPW